MYFRRTRSQYVAGSGAGNRRAFQRIVRSGREPGVIAYVDGKPAGWCAVEPRSAYATLARSRILAPVDEKPVWSIVCFFVKREHRERGLTRSLIEGAVAHAKKHGARVVEAYPVEPKKGRMPDVFAFTGLASAFRKAGFREIARRSETRPILRRTLRGG